MFRGFFSTLILYAYTNYLLLKTWIVIKISYIIQNNIADGFTYFVWFNFLYILLVIILFVETC